VLQIDRYVFLILKALSTDSSTFFLITFDFKNRTFENQHHLHLANFYLQKYLEKFTVPFDLLQKHQKLIKYDLLPAYPQLRRPRFIENWIFLELLDNLLKYL
jgi:hypothetical protein